MNDQLRHQKSPSKCKPPHKAAPHQVLGGLQDQLYSEKQVIGLRFFSLKVESQSAPPYMDDAAEEEAGCKSC